MKVIRPRVAKIVVIAGGAVNLIAIVALVLGTNKTELLSLLGILALIDVSLWLFFVEPRIEFDHKCVKIVNPIRVFRADWAAVERFETKFGLSVVTKNKSFVAWSAPAPSRRQVSRLTPQELKGTALSGLSYIEPGLVQNSESGSAYLELEAARSACKSDKVNTFVTMNWLGVAALIAIAVLAAVTLHN
jgi:hypothetical protein